jgi:hypothetical protein
MLGDVAFGHDCGMRYAVWCVEWCCRNTKDGWSTPGGGVVELRSAGGEYGVGLIFEEARKRFFLSIRREQHVILAS